MDFLGKNILNLIFNKIPLIFWTVDKNLVFTSSFGGGLEKLGLKENQVVGMSLFEYFQVDKRNFPAIEAHLEALNGKTKIYFQEWQNILFQSTVEPIYDENNEIVSVFGYAIDVTPSIRSFDPYKLVEKKFEAIFNSAIDAIFLMDGEIFIDCNQATLDLFKCSREEIIGQPSYKFSPKYQPDGKCSKEKALELIQKALDGIHLTFEWVHTKLTGEEFHTEVRLNRIEFEEKIYILAIVRDISERIKKDQKIKLLARALESIHECVSITDFNDIILYVNSAFERTYGYKLEEILGKHITILRSDKNTPEMVKDIYPDTVKGGWVGELWNKRKNGEDFLIRLSTSPVYDEHNNLIALIGVAIDITKEKELYNKIKYDAERLKILFENAPDAIFVCNYNGKIVEANRASEQLAGYTREEIINKTLFELNLFDKSSFYKVAKIFYKSIKTQPTGPDEILLRNKKGEPLYIEVSTYPIVIENEKLILCTARNITERKKVLFELAKAKEEAEKANKMKTLFFAQVSHEIRTPINAILGFNEVLKDIFYEKSDSEVKSYFEILENAANTLLNTVSQVLDFSRIESGTFIFELKPLSFNEEINRAFEMLKVLAERKKLKICLNLPEENVMVLADQYSLNGILINLISNAIKYSEKGVIKISLKAENDYGVCEIKDEGIGMSEEFQKNLFGNFSRDKCLQAKKIEGTGLGLALTKKYIELNKGEINISSKKGIGTTVIFKIPIAKLTLT